MNIQVATSTIEKLEQEIAERREELLSVLAHWNYLQNIVQPQLLFQYENLFGDLEIEMEKKARLASELERRQKLLSNQLQNGLRITESTLKFIDNVIRKEAERESHSGVRREEEITYDASPYSYSVPTAEAANCNISTVYHSIVKKLHPDISGESENFKKYWDSVQYAYRTKNADHLILFQKTLCPDTPRDFDCHAEKELALRRELQDLDTSLYRERRRLERLRNQEPFVFEMPMIDEFWVSRRKRRIRDRIFQIDRQIHFHERMIHNLTGRFYESTGRRIAFNDYQVSRA